MPRTLMIWAIDSEGTATFVGGEWEDYASPASALEINVRLVSNIHPHDLEHVETVFADARRLKLPFTCIFRMKHRDGSWRRLSARGVPTISPVDGHLVGHLGTTYEVSPGDLAASAVGWADLKQCALHGPRAGIAAVADHLLLARAHAEEIRAPGLADICDAALRKIFEPFGLDPTARQ